MTIVQAIALITQLAAGVREAIAAGRQEVSEEDLDRALREIQVSDDALSAAIERARQREADEAREILAHEYEAEDTAEQRGGRQDAGSRDESIAGDRLDEDEVLASS